MITERNLDIVPDSVTAGAPADEYTQRLAHLDEAVHEVLRKLDAVTRLLERAEPLLARAEALSDPGAKLRGAFRKRG